MNDLNKKSVHTILHDLTLEEKIGQLLQLAPFFLLNDIEVEIFGSVQELNLDKEKIFNSGSMLGIGSAEDMIKVQSKYLENSRHKIPLVFMADIVHGYKTIFPVPIALASSFSEKLVYTSARISADEATTAGIHVTFSPVSDISKDPRWGRVVETFGEDSYLAGVMSKAMVKGYQQDNISLDNSLASCVKHFAAYGVPLAGRDYNTVTLSHIDLYSEYLKPYKEALDAGARLIMTAFNTIDRVPCTTNSFLLRNILRDKWKSNVVTISDYDSLRQIIDHGVAKDMKEVAYQGIQAGLDIEMQSTAYTNHLEGLIKNKAVDERLVDEAVLRVLQLKKDLGLFENPYKGAVLDDSTRVLTKENLESARMVAEESMVLLKNDGVLPLDKHIKIALIGPYADSKSVIGPWSWHGSRDVHPSLMDVFEENIIYHNNRSDIKDYTEKDLEKINQSDFIIFALGEPDWLSGEAHSRTDITLPNHQEKLMQLAKRANKKSVVLLFNGRPLVLENTLESNAIIECWFLGSESSNAIKNVLFGDVNPSGKLPISFPRNLGQVPYTYNHLNTGRPFIEGTNNEYVSKYMDSPNTPQFCFGYGLSYAKFKYTNLNLSKKEMRVTDSILASVNITNESNVTGKEVVQLYVKDVFARVSRPVKELKAFKKIELKPNETTTVSFEVSIKELVYQNILGEDVFDYGEFVIMIGCSSDDYLEDVLYLVED